LQQRIGCHGAVHDALLPNDRLDLLIQVAGILCKRRHRNSPQEYFEVRIILISDIRSHVKQFYAGVSPDRITEDQLRKYFLHLKNDRKFAPGSLKVAYHGIRFFFSRTVKSDWETLRNLRIPKQRKLPAVLSVAEVRQLLDAVRTPRNRIFFLTVYLLGLRLQEALQLQVGDINAQRGMVHVHHGKGNRDRYVPLPEKLLKLLREHWKTHRHPTWLFPATDRKGLLTVDRPMSRS
jgi:integrase